MRNAYRSRQHKPVIIPKPCLREPSRNKTKTYDNDRQRPSSYDTTFDKRIFVDGKHICPNRFRHLERMQQIVINHSFHSQPTKARYSRLRTRKAGWKTVCLVSVATCKAMQLRLSHTLHPAADKGCAYVQSTWRFRQMARSTQFTYNYLYK